MITLTTEQAQQIEKALAFAASHSEYLADDLILYGEALATIRAARGQEQAEQEPIGMIIGGRLESLVDKYETGAWPIYAAPVQQAEQEPVVDVFKFLLGEGELEGCSFGEKPSNARGNYWWRIHLRRALAEQADVVPLCTRPVRTKDLTDDEIADVFRTIHVKESWSLGFARAVIAVFKEKNR